MPRVRMLRSLANRLHLREGVVCVVSDDEAERFIAAQLAEPVADDAADPSPGEPTDPPAGHPLKGRVRKGTPKPTGTTAE